MEDKNIFLNKPIGTDDEDIFGVKIYVTSIKQSILEGAKTIAVTSSFGGGKSSVFKLLEKEYKHDSEYKLISINMWNQIDKDSLDSLRKNFLYHLSSSLINDNTYISKVLSKNYGVLDLSFDFTIREKIIIGIISLIFVLLTWYKNLIYAVFQVINAGRKSVDVLIFMFVVIAVCTLVFKIFTSINIAFSSKNSENNRELEEVDYFRLFRKIIEKASEEHIIIALEDMDRTNDYHSIIAFISEIKKFSDSYNGKKSLVVIFAVKSEIELLKAIYDSSKSSNNKNIELSFIQQEYNIYYDKYFDYVVDIPKVNTIDYSIVLRNLLKKSKNIQLFYDKNGIKDDKLYNDLLWLTRGRNLSVRKLKERMNNTFLLYESIRENNPTKTIDLKKCAISTYLKSEYPLIMFALKDDGLDHVISEFMSNKTLSIQNLDSIINVELIQSEEKEAFFKDLQKMITNGLIDVSYRFYLYNTPKNTGFLDIEETYVSNLILHDKKIEIADKAKIDSVSEDVIVNSLAKYNDLGIGFPKNIFYNIRFFKLAYYKFKQPFEKELYNYIFIDNGSLNDEQIDVIISDINNYVIGWGISEDSSGILKLRKTLLKGFEQNFNDFEKIFKYENTLVKQNEIEYIHSIKVLYGLINFDSNLIDYDFFEFIDTKIQELVKIDAGFDICLINDIYIKMYQIIKNHKVLINYCVLLKEIRALPRNFNDYLREDTVVFEEIIREYADVVNVLETSSVDYSIIELINLSKEKVFLSKNIIDEIYKLDVLYYIVLMIYNDNASEINYSDEIIQDTIENNINSFSNDELDKIRESVIKNDVDWVYLFEGSNNFIRFDEISKSKDISSALKYIDKERFVGHYNEIYKYFYSLDLDIKSIKIIFDFIFSINSMDDVFELLQKIDSDKLPFGCLHKKDQNNKLDKLCQEINLSSTLKLELLKCLNVLNANIEKTFSSDDLLVGEFESKYADLIKNSYDQKITKTTIANIRKMKYLHIYDYRVEKALLENKLYLQYIYSKTERTQYFEFPFEVENQKLIDFCVDTFDGKDNSREWLRDYMFKNEMFMNLIIKQKNYMHISQDNIQKMCKFTQDKDLLSFILDTLSTEQVCDYFSCIVAFKNHEAMAYAVNYAIDSGLCVYENVYKNLYEIAIDPKYKSKLTRCYNKLNNA